MSTAVETDRRRPPELPYGTPTALDGFSETFSFHSSPESFIASRILKYEAKHPEAFNSRAPVRAKILNRDIALITSHAQITHVLGYTPTRDEITSRPTFVASEAYKPFMSQFFPSPNILLADGFPHQTARSPWEARIQAFQSGLDRTVDQTAAAAFKNAIDTKFDLYEFSKMLAWKILLGLFLGLDESDSYFQEIQVLQEDLLRGQFSLFPISINTRLWQSPRNRGIAARDKLQSLILKQLRRKGGLCPFEVQESELEEVANHLLLFTSSLAVKAIASLITPFLLNLFLLKQGESSLADKISELDHQEGLDLLRSMVLETERLSPPIVGIMRRLTRDATIPSNTVEDPDVLLPRGWDVWLYFVAGGRDPSAFGSDCAVFKPERFLPIGKECSYGFAFSTGDKQCLGQELVRDLCVRTGQAMLQEHLNLTGSTLPVGVKAWLGWEGDREIHADAWVRDMKQLPTQRPAKPVLVSVVRRATTSR